MELIVCKNYDECSKVAAGIFSEAISKNPNIIFLLLHFYWNDFLTATEFLLKLLKQL